MPKGTKGKAKTGKGGGGRTGQPKMMAPVPSPPGSEEEDKPVVVTNVIRHQHDPRFGSANQRHDDVEEEERRKRQSGRNKEAVDLTPGSVSAVTQGDAPAAEVEGGAAASTPAPGRREDNGDKENDTPDTSQSGWDRHWAQIEKDEKEKWALRKYVGCLAKEGRIHTYDSLLRNARNYFATQVTQSIKFPENEDLVVGGRIYKGLAKKLELDPNWGSFSKFWTGEGDTQGRSFRKLCKSVLQGRQSSITVTLKAAVLGEDIFVAEFCPEMVTLFCR